MRLLTLMLILFSQTLWGEIKLVSDRYNPYVNEIFEVEAEVPGDDTEAPVEVLINHNSYELMKRVVGESFSYNNITGESSSSVTFRYTIVITEAIETTIQYNINGELTNEIVLSVKPLELSKNQLPYLVTELSSKELYTGEIGYITNTMFSTDYIGDVSFIRPFMDLNASKLNGTTRRNIVVDDIEAKLKVVSAYSIFSNTPGDYEIPGSKIIYNDYNFITPSYKVEVKDLPEDITEEFIIGRSLYIDAKNILDRYENGEFVDFTIILQGNANLNDVDSLTPYFSIPPFLTEKLETRISKLEDGELRQKVTFSYQGRVNSFTGFKIPEIKINFFNTESGNKESVKYDGRRVDGNIPILLLYGGLLIILAITFGIILFTIRFFKGQKKVLSPVDKGDPAEAFNLSKREKEIFTILVNGKSTKEIAEELYISPETVKKHIQSILKKTNTNSRLELLALVNTLN